MKLLIAVATACCAFAPAAFAQTANPPAPTVRQLTAADASYAAQEEVLVKKLRLLELQVQVAEQEKKLNGGAAEGTPVDSVNLPMIPPPISRPGSVPAPASGPAAALPALPDLTAPPAPLFRVVSVWGFEGAYVADILAGGMRVSVRRGDSLPSGWRVHEVLRTGVVIAKGKKRDTLMVGG